MSRIVVAGGPRTGKTTLAAELAREQLGCRKVLHTDNLIGLCSWSEASARVARWIEEPAPWIIEGVAAVRALRKWFAAHPRAGEQPASRIYWLERALVPRTPGQDAMAKACATVWAEVLPELRRRRVEVVIVP
jgi:hypothetical protein